MSEHPARRPTSPALSRRTLIRGFGLIGGAVAATFVAACAPAPAPTATTAPPPKPTTAPAPAPTTAPAAPAPTTAPAPKPTTAPAAPAATAPAAPATAAAGGAARAANQILKYLHQVKLTHFDPAQEAGYGRFMTSNVFLPPFILDDKMNLLPGTCQSYEVSPDGLQYTLRVDPAAKWSDGSKFTAKDIKGWMEFVASPSNPGPYKTQGATIKGYPAVNKGETKQMEGLILVDDLTLKIVLDKTDPLFHFDVLSHFRFGGPKPELAQADPKAWWSKSPPASGPFTLTKLDLDTGDGQFSANPQWWRPTKPTLTRVDMLGVLDTQTMAVMWQNNEVDAIFFSGDDAINHEEKYPESIIPMAGWGGPFFWAMNVSMEPTNDINVRKALKHAVDNAAIVQPLYRGKRKPMRNPLSPHIPGSRWESIEKSHEFFKYDPELAKKELAASKYGGPDKLPAIAVTPNATTGDKVRATEMVVEMWRKNLGITKIESRPRGADYGTLPEFKTKINYLRISHGGWPDAAAFIRTFGASQNAMASSYMGGYMNPKVDELAEKAYFLDRKDPEFLKLVHQAEDQILSDYIYVPLYIDEYAYYVKPWVKGMKANYNNLMYTLNEVFVTQR